MPGIVLSTLCALVHLIIIGIISLPFFLWIFEKKKIKNI